MRYTVYLSGEIHSDWRDQIKKAINQNGPTDRRLNTKYRP